MDRPYQYLYNAKWAKMSKAFRAKNPLCVYCLQVGKTTEATVVDHIQPHLGNVKLFNDPNNLQSLCKRCHNSVKAREESRGYAVGCGADGLPIDKNHEWNKKGKMKRYDIEDTGTPGESYYEMIENDDGEWVKWEDVRRYFSVIVRQLLGVISVKLENFELMNFLVR